MFEGIDLESIELALCEEYRYRKKSNQRNKHLDLCVWIPSDYEFSLAESVRYYDFLLFPSKNKLGTYDLYSNEKVLARKILSVDFMDLFELPESARDSSFSTSRLRLKMLGQGDTLPKGSLKRILVGLYECKNGTLQVGIRTGTMSLDDFVKKLS